jgi:hypothetical protein
LSISSPEPRDGLLHWLKVLATTLSLGIVAASLQLLGGHRTAALLRRVPRGRSWPRDGDVLTRARAVSRRVARVAAWMPGRPRCLARALLIQMLLRRRGIAAEVALGVAHGQPFEAHAWVEVDGVPVSDDADVIGRYTVLQRLRTA